LTTASTLSKTAVQSAAWVASPRAIRKWRADSGGAGPREKVMQACPASASRATSAEPMKPVAPMTSTRICRSAIQLPTIKTVLPFPFGVSLAMRQLAFV
jgi:hypothetical protein